MSGSPLPCALVLVGLAACGGGDAKGGGGGGAGSDTGAPSAAPYLGEVPTTDTSAFDAAAVGAALNAALDDVGTLDARPALEAYLAALESGASAGCPDWYTDGSGQPYWADRCDSAAGVAFEGYGYAIAYQDQYDGWATLSGVWVYSVAELDGPGGAISATGYATWSEGPTDDGAYVRAAALERGWSWPGGGPSPAFQFWSADYGGGAVYLSVAVHADLAPGGPISAVVSEGLTWTNTPGAPCVDEPRGLLSARLADGHWVDIAFDGPTWDAPDGTCDGCGRAWVDGVEVAPVCVDAAGLAGLASP